MAARGPRSIRVRLWNRFVRRGKTTIQWLPFVPRRQTGNAPGTPQDVPSFAEIGPIGVLPGVLLYLDLRGPLSCLSLMPKIKIIDWTVFCSCLSLGPNRFRPCSNTYVHLQLAYNRSASS